MSNQVHLTMQGKGGVGKSFVTSILAQYFMNTQNAPVHCIDTDPINQTFKSFASLNVDHLPLLEGSRINERRFDTLMERLISEPGIFVVDNGASSFVPIANYLVENDAISMLVEAGRKVVVHCVITGGLGLIDTLAGFKSLAEQLPGVRVVLWLNEFFGPVEANGKTFESMKVYTDHAKCVDGIIRLARRNYDTVGKDVEQMIVKRLTFTEAINGESFGIMTKQRLKTVQNDVFGQLAQVHL